MLISQVELSSLLIMACATNRARFSCDPKTVKRSTIFNLRLKWSIQIESSTLIRLSDCMTGKIYRIECRIKFNVIVLRKKIQSVKIYNKLN